MASIDGLTCHKGEEDEKWSEVHGAKCKQHTGRTQKAGLAVTAADSDGGGPHTHGSNLSLTQYSDLVISRVSARVQCRQLSLTVDGQDDVVVADKW